jgi:hypothetical protein
VNWAFISGWYSNLLVTIHDETECAEDRARIRRRIEAADERLSALFPGEYQPIGPQLSRHGQED